MTLLAAGRRCWPAVRPAGCGDRHADGQRGRAEIENLIGFFVNTLALRLDLSGSPTVSELLEQVKAQALAAQQHQDIPFEQVVELLSRCAAWPTARCSR